MSVDVRIKGPLFDGTAKAEVPKLQADIEKDVGQHLVDEIQARLGRVLRRPTGFYQRQVRTSRAASSQVVTDGGVVYGAWLEGVSRRNKASRFKGYRTFRIVAQQVAGDAGKVAAQALPEHVRRMQ